MKTQKLGHWIAIIKKLLAQIALSKGQKKKIRDTIIRLSSRVSLYSVLIYVARFLFSFGVKETVKAFQKKQIPKEENIKKPKRYRVVPPDHLMNVEAKPTTTTTTTPNKKTNSGSLLNLSLNDSSILVSDEQFIHPKWIESSAIDTTIQGMMMKQIETLMDSQKQLQTTVEALSKQQKEFIEAFSKAVPTMNIITPTFDFTPPKN